MAALTQVLKSIITRKCQLCSLCLEVITGKSVTLQDEIIIKEDDKETAVKIFNVLSYILGPESCSNISAFDSLCKQCTRTAVTCYKFISKSKDNLELLSKALCNLNSCFESVDTDMMKCKTVFVTIDSNNLTTQQYYDNKLSMSSTSNAFKRFQSHVDIDGNYQANKRKRRDYLSYPIKSKEMLYDSNDHSNLKCKICLKAYPSLSNLRNHFIRVHAPKVYKCPICKRKFGSMALVDAHKTTSHCTVVCSECGKTFNNRHTLKMHELGHCLKLVCQDCGRVYKSQTTFKKHIDLNICGQATRASPSNAKFTCDYCNKKYTQKVSLRVHIQFEHGNYKGHECKWCHKKFWAKSRLDAHIVKHTQDKKFQCTMCLGKFVSKESLLYHTRIHTGEKPYKCDFCDNRFLSTSRRADHIKRHHPDVTFQCDICNLKYTTQLCLENHRKTHTEAKKPILQLQLLDGMLLDDNDIFLEISDEENCN